MSRLRSTSTDSNGNNMSGNTSDHDRDSLVPPLSIHPSVSSSSSYSSFMPPLSSSASGLLSPSQSPVTSWNFDDIIDWIKTLFFPVHIEKRFVGFMKERVMDGRSLLLLTKEDLHHHLSVPTIWVDVFVMYTRNLNHIGKDNFTPSSMFQISLLCSSLTESNNNSSSNRNTGFSNEAFLTKRIDQLESLIQNLVQKEDAWSTEILATVEQITSLSSTRKRETENDDHLQKKVRLDPIQIPTSSNWSGFVEGLCLGGLIGLVFAKSILNVK